MSYVVKLQNLNFDGPLDLLLQLINKAKIDIKDILVSDITEQYIAHIERMKELDMNLTSDFIEMAALLLEIKSRALLPKAPEPEGEETPEQMLIRRLEEYKACKELAEKLDTLARENSGRVFRLPMETEHAQRIDIENLSLPALIEAFDELLKRAATRVTREEVKQIAKDKYTIHKAIGRITERLKKGGMVKFTELFETGTREEIVILFIALLELWRLNLIKITQKGVYADIYISYKKV